MGDKMRFYALVEDWHGESMAYFRELPGCFSSAPTCEEAVKAAPDAISAFLKWSKQNDLAFIEDNDGEIEVILKERLSAINGQVGPRFEADLSPPDDVEIDNALDVAAAARAALLELYDDMPPAQRNRPNSPDGWSLTQHLNHILEAEVWYISRLTEYPIETSANVQPSDLSMVLFENAMDHELILRGLSLAERERVFLHEGEEWTAAKVLRRMTGHLREHYPWMVAIAEELNTR
jgi:predicted RNase H-like HicB family nuclease